MASLKLAPHRLLSLPGGLRSCFASPSSRQLTTSLSRAYATYNTNFTSTPGKDAQPQRTPPYHSSVNHTEVSHFTQLASSWWDPHGPSSLLHLMNPLRHDFIERCLATRIRDEDARLNYLDIGCGGGIFAESAARRTHTASVTAIDPTPEVIAVARRHARADPRLQELGRLTYINTAIENLPLPDASPVASVKAAGGYDIVTLFEVIEHIQQPVPFLRHVLQHLRPGGWLIGSTIARTGVSWLTTKFLAEEVLQIVPRGTHEWSQYIQPAELRDWARYETQLDVNSVSGDGFIAMGVVYVPGIGWKEVPGSADWGNYFFGVRKLQ